MERNPAKVLVVDDHALFRDGLVALIGRWDDFVVVGTAAHGAQAVQRARTLKPDLILMDVRMTPMGGVEATRLIRQWDPDVKIVMLTMSNLGEDMFQALRNGAHGYVSKDEPADRLRGYLSDVMNGGTALSSALAAQVLAELATPAAPRTPTPTAARTPKAEESLTARERAVLRLVVDGLSNDEIAQTLHLGEATVKKHLGKVMAKLHMHNRVQVAVFGVRQGIVP